MAEPSKQTFGSGDGGLVVDVMLGFQMGMGWNEGSAH